MDIYIYIYIYILWTTPSAAGPRPLHSRIADSLHCCKRILAFFGIPTCRFRISGFFFGTLGSITKDTLRSRPGFLLISGGFCCPWLLFGCLAPLLWLPGGPWDDPGTLEGTRKDTARSRHGFYRFFDDLGDPFWEFFEHFWTKKKVFFISISRLFFLLVFGSKFGCLGLEKQAVGTEEIGFLVIPESIFHDFG